MFRKNRWIVFCITFLVNAAVISGEVVELPSAAAWGGGDAVGSRLIGRTYNAGEGPGIWIVADGGYRLYYNGELLAQDNQAGRVRFVPMTFLPGINAVSVVGVDGDGAPGVLVQMDELDRIHYSGAAWKVITSVSDDSWKRRDYNSSLWANAQVAGNARTLPSGSALTGFAQGSDARWIWSGVKSGNVILRYTFEIKAEGFGAAVTGGDGGSVVVADNASAIQNALQSSEARVILVPEGTYDLRSFRNAVTDAAKANRTWCRRACSSNDVNRSNTHFRISFEANSCAALGDGSVPVAESENLQRWERWIVTRADKTLLGMGRGANLRGVAVSMRSNEGSQNIILRNLAIYDVNPHLVEANDGISTVGTSSAYTSKLWVDHVSYKWISDGLDVEYTKEATVSWLDFDGANEYNCWATDPYMSLVQNSEITFANVYWRNTYGRVPKASSSGGITKVHMYNNYLDYNRYFIVGASGSGSAARAEVLYENNYISRAQSRFTDKGSHGYIRWTGNGIVNSTARYYDNGTAGSTPPADVVFTPDYFYVKRNVADLPSLIPSYAGVGGFWGSMPSYDQAAGPANQAPVVSVTSPLNGAHLADSALLTLSANAMDNDGEVVRVDFYIGTTLVGTDATAPYSISVPALPAGTYSIVAVATDDNGLENMSEYVTFTAEADANTPPVFTLSGTTFTMVENAGKSVTQITAHDEQNDTLLFSISGGDDQAHFIINASNGNLWMVRNPDFESPRDADGNNQYKVRVRVTDAQGLHADAALLVTVVDAPDGQDSSSAGSSPVMLPRSSGMLNLHTEAVRFVVYDLTGRQHFAGTHWPWNPGTGRWIVRAYNRRGQELHNWMIQGN